MLVGLGHRQNVHSPHGNDWTVKDPVFGRQKHDPSVMKFDEERSLKFSMNKVALDHVDALQIEAEDDLLLIGNCDNLENDEAVQSFVFVETVFNSRSFEIFAIK